MSVPCVLVLAGLDPSGGSGLLADAEAIRAAGARPFCVPTALTAQTTRRARSFQPCAPGFLLETARALLEEEDIRAIKLGMLATPQLARAIGDLLAEHPGLPVVLDPVWSASSGALLFKGSPDQARAAVASLWARAVVTPNLAEAQLLLALAEPPRTAAGQEAAARALLAAGARAAIVKGGHGEGPASIDVLAWASPGAEGVQVVHLAGPRAPGTARGTGCRFASAIAAGLALGAPLEEAARGAKQIVAAYLADQAAVGTARR